MLTTAETTQTPLEADTLVERAAAAASAVDGLAARARANVARLVKVDGRVSSAAVETHQRAAHGLAWFATYAEALRQLADWGARLAAEDRLGETESLVIAIGFGEYLGQVFGGIPMSQGEMLRPADLGLDADALENARVEPVVWFLENGNTVETRAALMAHIRRQGPVGPHGDPGLDETLEAIRTEMNRFCEAEVTPHAHEWHLRNDYIPESVIAQMAELGVFGLTVPEEYGGLGLGKDAMCVVSEELSRAYIGVGSLGTRTEIAAELILGGGTEEQKNEWLPRLASGEILPCAVFTEPNTGSDLASLKTRATRTEEGDWIVNGNKTWITHPVRADMMTLLARTNPEERGYKGLSMFLATKPRGSDADPFPAEGMSGGEIEVLGYRGMKEYEIAFSDFRVSADALLGDREGEGFKQLMQTFESARIQTAARAVGMAQNALEISLRYAEDRTQFGKPIADFPRVADKIVMMAVETVIARQITYYSARQKDSGRRCDLEAGMAKLLAARVAWAAADNGVQIHGGNGFALEYPISRVLCDARILNIFEGAAEIQAQVIARRLVDGAN